MNSGSSPHGRGSVGLSLSGKEASYRVSIMTIECFSGVSGRALDVVPSRRN